MKNILFASSECVPFIKTGGLADVVGSLPKDFDKEKYDCRVVLPKYMCMKQEWVERLEYITNFYMDFAGEDRYVGIFKTELNGVTFYFIDNEFYFSGFAPYDGDPKWNIEKFSFFCKAVLSILPVIGFRPDLIHCHDWQTGLIPVYLDNFRFFGEYYRGIKTVMTIHNLKFQGVWDTKTVQGITGLPDYYFVPDKLEAYKDANMLKGGIVYADKVTTVSRSYAEEIKTPFYGEGLDGLMAARSNDLCGIVNGLDYNDWNPDTDYRIAKTFNVENFRKNKPVNKAALQEELGLDKDNHVMLIGIVSRLTDQKGLDLVRYAMDRLIDDNTQIVVIGTGDPSYEEMFRYYAWCNSDKVSANILYSDDLAHKLYAAADAFLMPSLFEPCGLTQIIAFHYGTIPIVRETGGLKDTVIPLNEFEDTGDGFSFSNYNGDELINTVNYSKYIYFEQPEIWDHMITRAMEKDLSWGVSKRRYEELYNTLIGR